jgi:hypothetical protein
MAAPKFDGAIFDGLIFDTLDDTVRSRGARDYRNTSYRKTPAPRRQA